MDAKMQFGYFVMTILLLGLMGCEENSAADYSEVRLKHIDNSDVKAVLSRAMQAAGGIEAYDGIQSLTYSKRSILYHEDGSVESDAYQEHRYTLHPELEGTIRWEDSVGVHAVIYGPDRAYRTLNGDHQADSEGSASRTFLSAYYVLFMPFKLLDPGVRLTYEGQVALDDDVLVDVIKADYNPGENANHSTSDMWWYYFDHSDGKYLASMVHHPPTYALIENNETTSAYDIVFNTYRKSFRTDSLRNKVYLRGEFYYTDFAIKKAQQDHSEME